MEYPTKQVNWLQLSSFVLIGLLTIEIILLGLQNRELKAHLSFTGSGQVEPLKSGDRVPSFRMQTLDGNTNELSYSDPSRKYLFFVLSTTCPHCEKTLPMWESLAKGASGRFSVLGLCVHNLDETKKYVSSKNVGFYLASIFADTSFTRKYKIAGFPETILVEGDGTVEKIWLGELSPEQTEEIKKLTGA